MSKPDRDGITLLILIIIVALILFHYASPEKETEATSTVSTTSPSKSSLSSSKTSVVESATPSQTLHPFDPNTADSVTLLSVGLRPWQVRNIMRYRARGGRYRQKEDFAQLYGLTLEQYRALEPYISIKPQVMAADVIKRPKYKRNYSQRPLTPSSLRGGVNYGNARQGDHKVQADVAPAGRPGTLGSIKRVSGANGNGNGNGDQRPLAPSSLRGGVNNGNWKRSYVAKLSPGQTVDANTADTTELKRIPGIGSYFARRIVSLRKQRQLFESKEELLSIRNFPESALQYITLSHNYPPIFINSMTQKELERHPLLNYLQARDIIRLRTTAGRINGMEDLSLLPSFSPQHLKRISSYIEY